MTAWIASHDGPGRVRSTHSTQSWLDAANWLRAMIEVWKPPSTWRALSIDLASSAPEKPACFRGDGHTFAIERFERIFPLPPIVVEAPITPREWLEQEGLQPPTQGSLAV